MRDSGGVTERRPGAVETEGYGGSHHLLFISASDAGQPLIGGIGVRKL